MDNQPSRPDPVDGLHLAVLQQRRDELLAQASGKAGGFMRWLLVLMLICGLTVIVLAALGDARRVLGICLGTLLIGQALFVRWSWRRGVRRRVQSLNLQIQLVLTQPNAAVIAKAAASARALLLRK